jgi:hypothetical protein
MGGYGSGSYMRFGEKKRVESCISLSVKELQKDKVLEQKCTVSISWGGISIGLRNYGDRIRFAYSTEIEGEKKIYDYYMGIDKTPCNYGGYRYWFVCDCGKRTSKLYLRHYYFMCRCCHHLTYKSQQESGNKLDEHTRRAEQIRKRLGSNERGFMDVMTPDKPKGMHWKTYEKLKMQLWIEEYRANNEYMMKCNALFAQQEALLRESERDLNRVINRIGRI